MRQVPCTSEIDLIGEWVHADLGGEVIAIERQARWRPNWLVDAEVDGQRFELMVRGHRIDSPLVFLLYHEMAFQDLLHRNGIPVPHIYGWLDELPAYVMDRVPGRPDFADSAVAERDAVMAEYMRILTDIHALDVGEFEAAGITRSASPSTPSSVGMAYFGKLYRQTKRRWDSGQFHHRDGKIAALLDLEIGHIGDPMMDLAAFRRTRRQKFWGRMHYVPYR